MCVRARLAPPRRPERRSRSEKWLRSLQRQSCSGAVGFPACPVWRLGRDHGRIMIAAPPSRSACAAATFQRSLRGRAITERHSARKSSQNRNSCAKPEKTPAGLPSIGPMVGPTRCVRRALAVRPQNRGAPGPAATVFKLVDSAGTRWYAITGAHLAPRARGARLGHGVLASRQEQAGSLGGWSRAGPVSPDCLFGCPVPQRPRPEQG